jgi:hypothetical protein
MCKARRFSWSSTEMLRTSPSSMVSSPSSGAKHGGGAWGAPSELQVCTVSSGVGCSWPSLAVDSVIFEGLLGGGVREGFAFLLRQECYLCCIVDGCDGLGSCSLGGVIVGCFSLHERWAPNVGTCPSRQVDPTGNQGESLQCNHRMSEGMLISPCLGIVRGYLWVPEGLPIPVKDI